MDLALYIHIPFCTAKCPYCDFYSEVKIPQEEIYLQALESEVDLLKSYLEEVLSLPTPRIKTLYIGGGTPSLLSPKFYERLISKLQKSFIFHPSELSIEANPETLTLEKVQGYREVGFNRISLGIQSLQKRGLIFLQRRHTLKEIFRAIDFSKRANFENISFDFIYGWKGQGLKGLYRELCLALSFNPNHLSFYELTLYPHTPFYHRYLNSAFLNEKRLLSFAKFITTSLTDWGYFPYEISNFAKPGFECKHNLAYWKVEPYLGLGAGAVSRLLELRFKNPESVDHYYEAILVKKKLPFIIIERLNTLEVVKEKIFMGLRLTEGISLEEIEKYSFHIKASALEELIQRGLLTISENNLKLTLKGRFLHQVVVGYLWKNLEKIR
ncbi:MAG: radical SAM family heme chaperone HemW [Caldimicrobium sp.]|nr:radical SAM family heme chaperone HemW [Caldimicrobium sp.]MCX7872921.1 radical SAM family heme chaperone HemW [Caldimicrobium sp.]MDW8094478.1 radical SAM family heme chaperone HemW [Caldimicrobium sp.]